VPCTLALYAHVLERVLLEPSQADCEILPPRFDGSLVRRRECQELAVVMLQEDVGCLDAAEQSVEAPDVERSPDAAEHEDADERADPDRATHRLTASCSW
jgi:hypothetical protein